MNTLQRFLLVILLLICACSNSLFSQDMKVALGRMRDSFLKSPGLSLRMSLKVFSQPNMTEEIYSDQIEIAKEQDRFHYRMKQLEMLLNDRFMVMVDKTDQKIILSSRSKESAVKTPLEANLDSLSAMYKWYVFKGTSEGYDHYELRFPEATVELTDVYVDHDRQLLKKIIYHYRSGQVALIDFLDWNTSPVFESGRFDESQYVQKAQTGFVVQKSWKGYHIVKTEE